jgi:hypothetical protein
MQGYSQRLFDMSHATLRIIRDEHAALASMLRSILLLLRQWFGRSNRLTPTSETRGLGVSRHSIERRGFRAGNTIGRTRVGGSCVGGCMASIRLGVAAAWIVGASSVVAQDDLPFEVIMKNDGYVLAARVPGSPTDRRWVALEMRAASVLANGQVREMWQEVSSIDCQARGYERIVRIYNIEPDPTLSPRWGGYVDPRYADGFNSRLIDHRLVEAVARAEHEATLASLKPGQRALVGQFGEHRRADLSVGLDFACAIVNERLPAKEAVQRTRDTLGLSDVKTLSCNLQTTSGKAAEAIVRFHEPTGYVQFDGVWRVQRSVTPDRIYVKGDNRELVISRASGRVVMSNGVASVEGQCELLERKKF